MTHQEVLFSKQFKDQATKAICAVCFFIIAFTIILLFAVALTVLCLYGGMYVIALAPSLFTAVLAMGIASLGVLVLVFLLKFLYIKRQAEDDQRIEINQQDAPGLFAMISELAAQVGTKAPKKVYLSADVNAAVFYQSTFWSMFIPTRKNLAIGMGLVNTTTRQELKAILAHEFGHFSQRTMKVGSYVYQVNRVIFKILYENDSFKTGMQNWGNVNWIFKIFALTALKITEAIQWMLRKLYTVVNKYYLGLSREMEFHADAIAASVVGVTPYKSALLRTSIADASFNTVLDFYGKKIPDNIKSKNIYIEQLMVLKFLAELNDHPLTNQLPDISLEEQSKFDKSKLVIKDQWASHPSIGDRIKRLDQYGFKAELQADNLANELFTDLALWQQRLTDALFKIVSYEGEVQFGTPEQFFDAYKKEVLAGSFGKAYNGYYDYKNPAVFDTALVNEGSHIQEMAELYSDGKVDLVYTAIALANDEETFNRIANKELVIKTFDYDGIRHTKKEAARLAEQLRSERSQINEQIKINDIQIYDYFLGIEKTLNQPLVLNSLYQRLFDFDKDYEDRYDRFVKLMEALRFVEEVTPFAKIIENLDSIKPKEQEIKDIIIFLLADPLISAGIPSDLKDQLQKYCGETWVYFEQNAYINENLTLLSDNLHNYAFLLSRSYFLIKKQLLDYQLQLLNASSMQTTYKKELLQKPMSA